MRLVIVESPFASPLPEVVEGNRTYLRACLRDCLKRGESPYASHGLLTQPGVLRDDVPEERSLGIKAGFAWGARADVSAFYCDRGWSKGMWAGLRAAYDAERAIEVRSLSFPVPFTPTRGQIADMLAGAGV